MFPPEKSARTLLITAYKHLSEMSVNFSVIHDGVANFQFAFVQRTRRRLKACYSKSVNSFLKIT